MEGEEWIRYGRRECWVVFSPKEEEADAPLAFFREQYDAAEYAGWKRHAQPDKDWCVRPAYITASGVLLANDPAVLTHETLTARLQCFELAVTYNDADGAHEYILHRHDGGRVHLAFGNPHQLIKEALTLLEPAPRTGDVVVMVAQALSAERVSKCAESLGSAIARALRGHEL